MNEEILWGLIRDCERARDLLGLDKPVTARALIDSVTERLWDVVTRKRLATPVAAKDSAPSGAEGGAPGPVVVQAEPGPVGGGAATASPARASIAWHEIVNGKHRVVIRIGGVEHSMRVVDAREVRRAVHGAILVAESAARASIDGTAGDRCEVGNECGRVGCGECQQ